jgi:hypothetical protein
MFNEKKKQKIIRDLQDFAEVEFGYHANHPGSVAFVARMLYIFGYKKKMAGWKRFIKFCSGI